MKTILCPLDFSAASPGLVTYAAALAAATGAALRLLHVVEQVPDGTDDQPSGTCTGRLAALRAVAGEAGAAHVSTDLRRGEAAAEIVTEAARCGADVIVIGAQGQTGLTRFLMGSTAEAVLRTATCATLLVRHPLSF